MSLGDEIASQATRRQGATCGVATVRAALGPDDAADFDRWLTADRLGVAGAISRALKARGIDLAEHTIARHRRGDCRCSATR